MASDLLGKNIFFYGLIREDGFADYIAEDLIARGATVYCLAAPELTETRQQQLAERKINVIKSPLWYGLQDEDYPDDFKTLKRPDDILKYNVNNGLIDSAFERCSQNALKEAQKIFQELATLTSGKIDAIIHIMAGGIPRTRGMMLLTKGMLGTADEAKFIPMQNFVASEVFQKIVAPNIDLVTAISYQHIFDAGKELLSKNKQCQIVALGYCGEHIMDPAGNFSFASYPGYLVGYAKNLLLTVAQKQRQAGFLATVVNLMGAETASTNAFAGIENFVVNSYRQLEQSNLPIHDLKTKCEALLLPGISMGQVVANADQYLFSKEISAIQDGSFPLLTSLDTAKVTIKSSEQFQAFHKDRKTLVAYEISSFIKLNMAKQFLNRVTACQESVLLLDAKQLLEL